MMNSYIILLEYFTRLIDWYEGFLKALQVRFGWISPSKGGFIVIHNHQGTNPDQPPNHIEPQTICDISEAGSGGSRSRVRVHSGELGEGAEGSIAQD